MKPLVAIVGRPNVGKSTFFNKIIGRRLAIIEDSPGVTRDRIFADAEWCGREFTMIDTGGIEPYSEDIILSQMRRQARLAMDMAEVILFFVDALEGCLPADHEVAAILRETRKKVILVLNKADTSKLENEKFDFYVLGFGEPIAISAQQSLGLGDLLDEIVAKLPPSDAEDDSDVIKIAVVGKPNVGKSSLVNRILNEERVIVSDIPGTTRDAIDTPFEVEGKKYMIIDTAGMRRKRSIEYGTIEQYSVIRSLDAVRRCDVALIVIDGSQGITEQDVKVAGFVHEQGKPSVLIINKWDVVEKETGTLERMQRELMSDLSFMDYVESLFLSAKTGQRVNRILPMAVAAYEQSIRRITTGLLNDIVHDAIAVTPPPSSKGQRLKIYYSTQVSVRPPVFAMFVNEPKLMHFSYQRYLENHFRKSFGFVGTPIHFVIRKSESGGGEIK